MAVVELPVSPSVPHYTERVQLDGQTYVLTFRWNTRVAAWFMDVADVAGTPIVVGRRITVDSLPLGQFKHLAVPPGTVIPFDTTNRQLDPALDDFGTRVLLIYHDQTEVLG